MDDEQIVRAIDKATKLGWISTQQWYALHRMVHAIAFDAGWTLARRCVAGFLFNSRERPQV